MENGCDYDLIISALLKTGDLDIRGTAAKNELLPVRTYFNKVEQFMEKAPQVADDLFNLAEDKTIYQRLMDIQNLLGEIGYHKLTFDIEGVLDAEKGNDKGLAGYYAKRVLKDLDVLYQRTKTACKTNQSTSDRDTDEPIIKEVEMSLKAVLERLDYEEDNRKLRILAVDDAPIMLRTISAILSGRYELFSLTKGALVEKFLLHTTPELFLLDVTMPDISGYDLIPVIRSFVEHKDTPIIFLTGNSTSEHVSTAISLGASDFITKPIKPEILIQKITKRIVRKRTF